MGECKHSSGVTYSGCVWCELEKVKAENAELRDALEKIAVWPDHDVREPANSMAKVARQALARLIRKGQMFEWLERQRGTLTLSGWLDAARQWWKERKR